MGKQIGIVESYALKEALVDAYPDIDFVGVSSRESGLKRVIAGKLFGFVDTVTAIGYSVQKNYYGELRIVAKLNVDWKLGVATRADEPLLNEIFNKVVRDLTREEHSVIFNRWIAVSYQKLEDNGYLWNALFLISLVLLFLVYRNYQLTRFQHVTKASNQQLQSLNKELRNKQEEISHMAYHDMLTGLPNKKYLLDELNRAIKFAQRNKGKLAVLFIDLDRFKTINDTLGHSVGDQFLMAISVNLQAALRDSDVFARVGGDEFIVLLEGVKDINEPAVVASKLLLSAAEKVIVRDYELGSTASIGIAMYPEDGEDCDSLVKNADSAMYAAKEEGKDRYNFYTSHLLRNIRRRLFLELAMREALEKDEFSLVYQPQISLVKGGVVGVEVLVRWQHKEEGFISPAEFIPVAEDCGLIVQIGEWVFDQACAQFDRWQRQGLGLPMLSINVSSVQFLRTDVVSIFNKILDSHNVDASCIEIEITEHSMMEDTAKNIGILEGLRASGFKIVIDDFGTGYSSMSYLRTMPINTVKIDKSFVDDLPGDKSAAQISNAIIALAHSLDFEVVAEGIETLEQMEFLQAQGCDVAQGYFLARPLIADDLVEFMSS